MNEEMMQHTENESAGAGAATNEKRRFAALFDEKLIAFLMFIPAYVYVWQLDASSLESKILVSIFVVCFLAMAEYLFRGVKRCPESWLWLGAFVAVWAGLIFDIQILGGVFECDMKWFLLHCFASYWLLVRSGRMSERGGSSHLLPLDLVNLFCIVPFKRFPLRMLTIIAAFRDQALKAEDESGDGENGESGEKGENRKKKHSRVLTVGVPVLIAVLAGGILLFIAVSQLAAADAHYASKVQDVLDALNGIRLGKPIGYFFLSLPVAAYVYGMVGGLRRETVGQVEHRGQAFMRGIGFLRKVPALVWILLILVFSVVYAAFYFLQAEYLFDAFAGKLPEGFIVSEYARQGFFEMCRVMAVNFVLLWLTMRTSVESRKLRGLQLIAECLLIAESLLFAVIAVSKLALYMDIFGFTPLRVESTWLVTVMSMLCISVLIHLFSTRRTAKFWVLFSGLSLAALCLM